jgi:chloramphenicol-sensitive protein RarD
MTRPPLSAILGAILAFGFWGVLPIFWKQLGHLGSDVAVAHRVVWTMVTVIPMLLWQGQWSSWLVSLRDGAVLRAHAWSALLLGINWGVFIWAAQHGHILEASLGYFINPLLNVLIGRVLLGERLMPLQRWSIGFAGAGALMQVLLLGHFPWIGLLLALSMGFYALARRRSTLGSLDGLAVETFVGVPFALAYFAWAASQHRELWAGGSTWEIVLIIALGIVTAVPLLGFAHAARKLPFATLGLLQFIAPTGQFLCGALLYHESVSRGVLVSFGLIWVGVGLFCWQLVKSQRGG